MQYSVHPDVGEVCRSMRQAIEGGLYLLDRLDAGECVLEDELGVPTLDVEALARSWSLQAPAELAVAALEAAGCVTALLSDDDSTVYQVEDNTDWGRRCLDSIRSGLTVAAKSIIEINVTPDRAHCADSLLRAVCAGVMSATPVESTASAPRRSSLPGVDDLDPQQRAAVEAAATTDLVINAGAGSGKTHTLAFRIAHIITTFDARPARCLVLTFSNAAKLQIKDRLNSLASLYPALADVEVRTIHSLARQVVLTATRLGQSRLRPGFGIVEDAELRIERNVIHAPAPYIEASDAIFEGIDDGLDLRARLTLYPAAIDALRNGSVQFGVLIDPVDLPSDADVTVVSPRTGRLSTLASGNVRTVWERYRRILSSQGFVDFPGLLTEAIDALRQHNALRALIAGGIDFLFIDEYQDTTRAQIELLMQLASSGARFNVVGDVDQTIFGFAGATVNNFLRFGDDVRSALGRDALVLRLETNYRSRPEVIELANAIIERNTGRLAKRMVASRQQVAEPGHVSRTQGDLSHVAAWIGLRVKSLLDEHVEPEQIAVLFRKEAIDSPQERVVRENLEKLQIPLSDDESTTDAVRILSIHRSKGLEFDHVFLLYLAAHHFPDRRGDPEEERRLLYVAVTRARQSISLAGSPGANPDLFGETDVGAAHPTLKEVNRLSDVIAGYDPWEGYEDSDNLEWDEAIPESDGEA